MSLNNFYQLREDFIILGLTGRTGGGCSEIAEFLSKAENPFTGIEIPEGLHINEHQKFRICEKFINNKNRVWIPFKTIKYKNVLALNFLFELQKELGDLKQISTSSLLNFFKEFYNIEEVRSPRIGQEDKTGNIVEKIIFPFLTSRLDDLLKFVQEFEFKGYTTLNQALENVEQRERFDNVFFDGFDNFCTDFFNEIDRIDPLCRQIFLQDLASNLRSFGEIKYGSTQSADNIYTVATTIKHIIKINKKVNGKCRLVIDALRNSLEINYFKERYSGFYLISSNRDSQGVKEYLETKIGKLNIQNGELDQELVDKLLDLDEHHYRTNEFKRGNFTSPDIENCIQKADYYIFRPWENAIISDEEDFKYYSFELQLLKLIALILKPGLITPNGIERNMQLAFSSKYNSGCISRQVGAIVTDKFYSVKSVGWNEVPQNQTPCSLRDLSDLLTGRTDKVFTDFELKGGDYEGKSFKQKAMEMVVKNDSKVEDLVDKLQGHNCPFCFKELHNSFESKDNQVHTRSLHAEENAMLQITKYGGQGIKDGNLFTTASPCELCSKKAYQLGIKNIYYIDPYPGIAQTQILKGGSQNPYLYMFQGAVGRGYFKFYDPYMSIKDETKLRTQLKPQTSQKAKALQLRGVLQESLFKTDNKELISYLDTIKDDENIIDQIVILMGKGLQVGASKNQV